MKDGLGYIIGKRIQAVLVAEGESDPRQQVFLVFEDGTTFEFWGQHFSCASGVTRGGVSEAIEYATKCSARVRDIYTLDGRTSPG